MPMRRSRIRSRSGACRSIAITEIEHPVFAIKITVGDFPAILIDKREISANLRSRQRRFVTRRLIPLRPTGNQREKCEKSERKKRSEEHTSELQSLMRISYAVFCLKKKKKHNKLNIQKHTI